METNTAADACAVTTTTEPAWPWIEEFARAVAGDADELSSDTARQQAARQVGEILAEAVELDSPSPSQENAMSTLLASCRVFMRERRAIESLLTPEAFELFLALAEKESRYSTQMQEETLKCMINSVHSRPQFVSDNLVPKGFADRLLSLARLSGVPTVHWLIWKTFLVSCESSCMVQYLSASSETWKLIHATLLYSFTADDLPGIIDEERSALMLELLKLITVLVNDMQWTEEQEEEKPEIYSTIHRLGKLLLDMLRFTHRCISPLHATLIDLKNKVMEVFMLLPAPLLAAFILQQQQLQQEDKRVAGASSTGHVLSPVIDHLHTMLLIVRVEKTRPLSDMIPTLIVCHNLAAAGDPYFLDCFKQAILPVPSAGTTSIAPPVGQTRTKTFFFGHLQFFLTCLDTDVRRYTAEWLFLLYDQNASEYTRCTGVGNAIGLLRMKGLA